MADAARQIDVLDTGPRFTATDVALLNARFQDQPVEDMLRAVLVDGLIGRVATVSSFGAESAVLLHMIAAINPATPILFLETGKHFPETLAYRDELVARLALTNLINLYPDEAEIEARDATGLRWSFDPDGCCELRKVKPLARGLANIDATITGRKGFQASTRQGLARFELDSSDAVGRIKVNPLANWKKADLDAYFDRHDLPRHPLEAEGYPSIGCAPCTSKVQPGEDPRAGRWRGWEKVECGIHVPTKPGEDPVF